MPTMVIGGGTNLIVSDEGFRGIVLRYRAEALLAANGRVVAQAGAVLQDLVDFTIDRGLKGLETLSGIPGSVGAAVYGNAGAYGHSISERVVKVQFFDGQGVRVFGNEECEFRYRESIFKRRKEWIIFSTQLLLDEADAGELRKVADDILKVRNEKFPVTMKCAGSIFKNLLLRELPPAVQAEVPEKVVREGKIPAAWFLEQVGAKGMSRGEIRVADYHANLIYNTGSGTAADLRAVIDELKARVRARFGIEIEEEVQYVGMVRGRGWGQGLGRLALRAVAVCFALPLFAVDLHQAVRSGDLDVVKELVGRGEDVNDRDTMGATPLHDAAWSGRLEIAAFLLERGADVRAKHAEGGSEPLAYAVIKNNREMAELLLSKGADVKAVDKSGATPLHLAADRGYREIAELLIAKGADVNSRDRGGASPLDEAAVRGHGAIIELLIEHGARADEESPENGSTPLNVAAAKGHREVVEALLAHGADRSKRSKWGVTPLESAVRGGHQEVAGVLLDGAPPRDDGRAAARGGIKEPAGHCRSVVAKGRESERARRVGATPLHVAALKGNVAVVELLLARGANADPLDGDGLTPLHDAALRAMPPSRRCCSIAGRGWRSGTGRPARPRCSRRRRGAGGRWSTCFSSAVRMSMRRTCSECRRSRRRRRTGTRTSRGC